MMSGLPSPLKSRAENRSTMPSQPVPTVRPAPKAVSYTHLDVYKRQVVACVVFGAATGVGQSSMRRPVYSACLLYTSKMCIRDRALAAARLDVVQYGVVAEAPDELTLGVLPGRLLPALASENIPAAVSYTHLDVYKRQAVIW